MLLYLVLVCECVVLGRLRLCGVVVEMGGRRFKRKREGLEK